MAKRSFNVAVVGATGNVGRAMLQVLAEREFPIKNLYALASSRSVGQKVSYGEDAVLTVENLEHFDFKKADIVLSSPGAKVSAVFAPRAAAAGAVVIDNTSHFRMDKDVPLVVPEVNAEALKDFAKKRIIANPNCSTIQLVVALKPLHDIAPISRVVVSTYQSVSGAGKDAMDELFAQCRNTFVNQEIERNVFQKQIAFNVIPQIDVFMEDGYTKEEWKMRVETKKILDADIEVSATCVRVPVFVGHAEAVTIEFDAPISVEQARAALKKAPGIELVEGTRAEPDYMTPKECATYDPVYVSRLRKDPTTPNALSMWIVADNVRKGAALNSVQIAEVLAKKYL
ncbi:MAG: aspartate-semialdehyde dehydrogenase [Alphaproteobacteria bacterium]|jgi:aspartate-semialdehyde dehydrogenase|nr:aspartate-semialdehyde dehydrogenase [Alphaproteobacteria bacterium]